MKCICCDANIKPSIHAGDEFVKTEEDAVFVTEIREFEEDKKTFLRAENRMWGNGIVGNLSAGYGSSLDGNEYVIAICDICTKEKQADGTIAFVGDYMAPIGWYKENAEEEARRVWRRYNQLDDLLSGKKEEGK